MSRPDWYRRKDETIAEWMDRVAPELEADRIGHSRDLEADVCEPAVFTEYDRALARIYGVVL